MPDSDPFFSRIRTWGGGISALGDERHCCPGDWALWWLVGMLGCSPLPPPLGRPHLLPALTAPKPQRSPTPLAAECVSSFGASLGFSSKQVRGTIGSETWVHMAERRHLT